MQIHETAINHYIQELQKTNFKYIQNKKKKNWRDITDNKYKSHHTKY